MLGRWFFLAVVGIGLIVIVNARKSDAAPARITQSCAEPAGPVAVTLAWRASRTPAAETWVDVALAPGFAPGTYAGPRAALPRAGAQGRNLARARRGEPHRRLPRRRARADRHRGALIAAPVAR